MNKLKLSVALGLMLATAAAVAETPQEASIKKLIQPRLGDGATVDSVTKTPYAGLFEVRVGSEIFYTDAQAKYLFVGRILDANTTEDYTKARVDEISRIKFSELPLESALKTVKGNGKRVIAVSMMSRTGIVTDPSDRTRAAIGWWNRVRSSGPMRTGWSRRTRP